MVVNAVGMDAAPVSTWKGAMGGNGKVQGQAPVVT